MKDNVRSFPERIQHRAVSEDHFEPPDPKDEVDLEHIRTLAATRQTAQIERRAENTRFHDREARKVFRQFISEIQGRIKEIDWQLSQLRPQLKQTKQKKTGLERFNGAEQQKQGKKQPATRWTQCVFATVIVIMVLAILNGTFTVSSVMLDSTAFTGQVAKTITIGLGFFLLPSLGLSIPFHLLRKRPRIAKAYLAFLVCVGIIFGFGFALTWAHAYAVETGNTPMIELSSIGMAGDEEDGTAKPWIFENAGWISLLLQILADMTFAGAAKSYLTYMSWNYALFNRKAFQQDPEWLLFDQEERDLIREIGELEARKQQELKNLEEQEQQQDEFVASVCSLADALFLREIDVAETHRQKLTEIDRQVAEREAEWSAAKESRQEYLRQNPGVQKGMHHVEAE